MMFSTRLFPKRSFLALAVVALVAPAAIAQTNAVPPVVPTHLEVAKTVLNTSGLGKVFENAMPNVVGPLRVNMTRQRPELTKDIEESLKLVEGGKDVHIAAGVDIAARVLATRMSEADLKEVAAFLATPAGKKYVETLPGLTDAIVQELLPAWSQKVSGDMLRVFQQEMLKRGHKL